MITPTQLIADEIVEEARNLYKKAVGYNFRGSNSLRDAVVIYGATRILKPKIMCEVGVASGFSSVLMLEGVLQQGGQTTLYAYDVIDHLYYDETRKVGCFLHDVAPQLEKYYRLHTGSYAAEFTDECKSGLGLAYIDAEHMHPWAALDVLVLLPAMEKGGYILLDAVSNYRGYTQGPLYLFHYWKGYKFVAPDLFDPSKPTTTGFLEYDGDAEKAVDSVLYAIGADWQQDVPDKYIEKVVQIVGNFVGEGYRRKFLDLIKERATQYRRYADMHVHIQENHFLMIDNYYSKLAEILNSRTWRCGSAIRHVMRVIWPFFGHNK